MNRLLILTPDADDYLKLLKEYRLSKLEILSSTGGNDAREKIQTCNIVLGEPPMLVSVLEDAACLQWVQSTFAGIDALCAPGLRRDYTLTGVKGIFGSLMSEYVFAYILALERQILKTRQNQVDRVWEVLPYRGLSDLTLGICGLGSIGRHVAKTADHFGMRVIAYKRTPEELPFVEQVYSGSEFNEFLGQADFLVIILPDTPETTGLINYDAIKHMKPSAVLINVGRGNAVVEEDLARALTEGVIHSAVLDVFKKEPLPLNSSLWGCPNAIITPHNSAFSFPRDIVRIFHDNYHRFAQNRPLNYVIDFERGY